MCLTYDLLGFAHALVLIVRYSPNATGSVETLDDQTETESVVSFRRERPRHRESMEQHGEKTQIVAPRPTSKQCKDCDIIKKNVEARNVRGEKRQTWA